MKNINKIVIGCEQLGGVDWGTFDIKLVERSIDIAYELGIRRFDTADVYGLGKSEKKLSKILGKKKNDVLINTKIGVKWKIINKKKRAETFFDSSPSYIRKAIDDSLSRLKVDVIDTIFIHWPDYNTPFIDTFNELQKARSSGKIRNIGVSNFNLKDLKFIKQNGKELNALQYSFNLLDQTQMDKINFAKLNKIKFYGYGPLAQGLLTGRYDINSKFKKNDRRHRLKLFSREFLKNNQIIFSEINEYMNDFKLSMKDISLGWLNTIIELDHIIVGIKNENQLIENIKSFNTHIPMELKKKLDKIYRKLR